MRILDSQWAQAAVFLRHLGYQGSLLEALSFREASSHYLQLLLHKNKEVNLTGAKDLETAFWKHFIDSLALLACEGLGHTVDWGCGGGLPGIPLALARRYSDDPTPVFFVDSISKKVRAVEEFCNDLGLSNTKCLVGRGEDLITAGHLRGVETVVMRAVAPPEKASRWIVPSIPNWILFLGPSQRDIWQQRIPLLATRNIRVRDELRFDLPHDLGQRSLLRLSKRST